jgi:hypothetical protein
VRYALAVVAAISCAGPPAAPVRQVPAPALPAEVDRSDAVGEEASRRGYDLLVAGRAAEVIAPLRKAYAIARERHPGTALAGISAATLAEALTDSGDCANALPIYDEAITVLDAVLPDADPKLSLLIGRKVSCLVTQHRDDDARRVLTALLERARAESYSGPAEIVARAHDMANQLVDAGDLVGAALLFESSIAGSPRSRADPLDDLHDAERRFRAHACRCQVRLCDRYFAAVVHDAHERGRARRAAEVAGAAPPVTSAALAPMHCPNSPHSANTTRRPR